MIGKGNIRSGKDKMKNIHYIIYYLLTNLIENEKSVF